MFRLHLHPPPPQPLPTSNLITFKWPSRQQPHSIHIDHKHMHAHMNKVIMFTSLVRVALGGSLQAVVPANGPAMAVVQPNQPQASQQAVASAVGPAVAANGLLVCKLTDTNTQHAMHQRGSSKHINIVTNEEQYTSTSQDTCGRAS